MNQNELSQSAEVARTRLANGLALPSRVGYTALLLAALAMTGTTGVLAATEVGLPLRTRASLAMLSVIGVAWVMFASWVLARREVLYVRHRVVSGWMAVIFSGLLTFGCVALRWIDPGNRWWLPAAAVGITMFVFATIMLGHARKAVRALVERRDALAAALRGAGEHQ